MTRFRRLAGLVLWELGRALANPTPQIGQHPAAAHFISTYKNAPRAADTAGTLTGRTSSDDAKPNA